MNEPKPDPTWIVRALAARSGLTIKRNPEYDDAPYEVTVTVDIRNKTAHMLLRRFRSMEDYEAFMKTGDLKYCIMPYIIE